MKVPTLNPVTALRKYINQAVAESKQTQPAPVNEPGAAVAVPEAPDEIVSGTFIDATNIQSLIGTIANHTQHHRKLVESFDEDKETFAERGVRTFYMALFYILPAIVAYFVGNAIGSGF